MQCQYSTKKKTTNATIRPKKKTRKHYQSKLPRTYIPLNCAPTSPSSPIYLSRPPPTSQTHSLYSFLPPRATSTFPRTHIAHPCSPLCAEEEEDFRDDKHRQASRRGLLSCKFCRRTPIFLVASSAVRVGYLNWRTAGLRRRPQTPSHCEDGGGARLAPLPRLALAPAF